MADKYNRLPRPEEVLPENEIRVRRDPRVGKYLKRANDILTGKVENAGNTIVLKGVQQAMENVVKLAELIKHRFTGLYQFNSIETIEIRDEYEPLEEGLDHLVFKRFSTLLTIVLTRNEPEDRNHIGYQDPVPDSEVVAFEEREPRERSVRSRRQSDVGEGGGAPRDGSRRRSRSRGRRGNRFTGQRGGGTAGAAGAGRRVQNTLENDEENGGRRRVTNTLQGGERRQSRPRYQQDDGGYQAPRRQGGNRGGAPRQQYNNEGGVRRYRDDYDDNRRDNYNENRTPRGYGGQNNNRGGQRGGRPGPRPRSNENRIRQGTSPFREGPTPRQGPPPARQGGNQPSYYRGGGQNRGPRNEGQGYRNEGYRNEGGYPRNPRNEGYEGRPPRRTEDEYRTGPSNRGGNRLGGQPRGGAGGAPRVGYRGGAGGATADGQVRDRVEPARRGYEQAWAQAQNQDRYYD